LLPNGQVLVAGGNNAASGGALASAKLYDPATGVWMATGSMAAGHFQHTATLLANGQVLVAGGNDDPGSAEVYDPASGIWMHTKNLSPSRLYHRATLLPDGNVLVSGGQTFRFGALARSQLYKTAP
jgi:N-acetylneuraminic acid mutarotase